MDMEKDISIQQHMLEYAKQDVVVAFSGGADSSLILKLAVEAAAITGKKVYGICIHTNLHPSGEADFARKVCEEIGAIFDEVIVDEFREAGIEDNPIDRCYRCKRYMFSMLKKKAEDMGVHVVMDGTNEDDLHVYRPGIRALYELGIKSPLAECGYTKAKVRQLLLQYGISVASRPSAPCLATRFPYGTHLTEEMLECVDKAEDIVKELGCRNMRVRVHGDIARLEVDVEDEGLILANRKQLIEQFKQLGYSYITLDLEGFRSGSMDIKVNETKQK